MSQTDPPRRFSRVSGEGIVRLLLDYLPMRWEDPLWVSGCPFCPTDGHPFEFNGVTKMFLCRGCKTCGDIVDFVSWYNRIGQDEAFNRVAESLARPREEEG